jgi:pimeloyl-ACP methyl ester carboxylesterase
VISSDIGGQPALAFARRHASRVRALVVLNSLLRGNAEAANRVRARSRQAAPPAPPGSDGSMTVSHAIPQQLLRDSR